MVRWYDVRWYDLPAGGLAGNCCEAMHAAVGPIGAHRSVHMGPEGCGTEGPARRRGEGQGTWRRVGLTEAGGGGSEVAEGMGHGGGGEGCQEALGAGPLPSGPTPSKHS